MVDVGFDPYIFKEDRQWVLIAE